MSFCRIVSGDRHVWQVTYSLIYLLKTFSICFCWNLPLITSWLLPSIEPLVPNSANKNARRCLGWRCNLKRKWNNINRIFHGNLTKLLKTSLSSLFCNYSAVWWILAQFIKLWNEDTYDTIGLHFKAHKTILHFIYKYIHTGKCL